LLRLLLDTHAFIWWSSNSHLLPPHVRAAIADPANQVFLSLASVWEMQIKAQLGKLTLPAPLDQLIAMQRANGLRILHIRLAHIFALEALPSIHRDPFDRLLVAQAQAETLELVTEDPNIQKYPVGIYW
jgi:PIN domain nuclease of toxin-antitoxin system